MTSARRRSLPAALVCLVAVLAVGVLVGVFVIQPQVPESVSSAGEVVSVPVSEVQTVDEQPATLVVNSAAAQTLAVRMSGAVTSTSCRAGESVASGASALSVNDAMLIYLATSRPLWRDLAIGDTGPDVRSLQEALADLGEPLLPDGRFGSVTLRAVADVAKRGGATDASSWSVLPFSRLIWLPAPTVQTVTCDRGLGDQLSEGDPVATLPRGISDARVTPVPPNVMPGEREAVVGDLAFPLDEAGAIPGMEDLARLAQSSAYRERADGAAPAGQAGASALPDNSDGVAVSVLYRLANPVTVFSVPAAAVYDTDGASACVLADGRPIAVTIAGSQLGQTLIVPGASVKLRNVGLNTRDAPACR